MAEVPFDKKENIAEETENIAEETENITEETAIITEETAKIAYGKIIAVSLSVMMILIGFYSYFSYVPRGSGR